MEKFWKASLLALTFAAILAVFVTAVRPWYLQWGASADEASMTLPGDELFAGAVGQTTRGITIDAGAEYVWPWVAQIGQDRGGFYSFDLLENIVGCQMPTRDVLRPEKQNWALGDKLWMYPPERAGGTGFATLRAYVPGHALVFAGRRMGAPLSEPEAGTWAMVVRPLDHDTTRLIFRGRALPSPTRATFAFDRFIFEPAHYVMERRTLIGIKQLVETGDRHRFANHAQVVLWTVTFALFVFSAVQVVRSRNWRRPLMGFVAAALVFQILTLVQPHLLVGVALTVVVAWLAWPWQTGGIFPRREETFASHSLPARA